jgi:5-formyltetrahydrofolate cyclo-ligase
MGNSKTELRARVLARRDALSDGERRNSAARITRSVISMLPPRAQTVVLAYSNFGSEFATADFIAAALAAGHVVALPRVDRVTRTLGLYRVSRPSADLVVGPWGIAEPDPRLCRPVDASSLDFVLVPGVAFDTRGARIGYGGGFYDRLFEDCSLQGKRPLKVAPAFACQIVEAVPVEPHDVPVDHVVTELASHPSLAL